MATAQNIETSNVARRLTATARRMPDAAAVIVPKSGGMRPGYHTWTFHDLDDDSSALARGLVQLGAAPGQRVALLVRPGFDFISLVFGLFKAGAVPILIDPGMGRGPLLRCLDEAQPQGFIAIPIVHAVRAFLRRRYGVARLNITVGRRWFWGGTTLAQVRDLGRGAAASVSLPVIERDDAAAIIFTSGSTGPAKGVLYRHGNFDRQVDEIQGAYQIQPGEIDLSCFPLFALFNCAMGVTTVVPCMDFSRPATVDPAHIVAIVRDLKITQAFGSPAVWNRVGRYCEEHKIQLPTLRRVLSAGAPVHADVLARMKAAIHPQGDVHTPYGATEALPVATISATEVLGETAARTREGGGVCVGQRFPGIQWKIIRIVDGPISALEQVEELAPGQIGELIVRGDVVTREYFARPEANALGKIPAGDSVWHRMGDVGYLDGGNLEERQRFWFCGRMAQRVETAQGTLFTIPCEAIINAHPKIFRSALVGLGPRGKQIPSLIAEPHAKDFPRTLHDRDVLLKELRQLAATSPLTSGIEHFLLHRSFPVDVRHNAKIFREQLAVWADRHVYRDQV